ncbi:catalytic domain of components of various dehydrogenase complexes [Candidatus Vecturithrix granuli]|uniref:Dihydrolipoamide acetyltransferase component of pyruvate dehydrogenase complex n=1 Tax=Vecturithrix granuli TaxID=1499967 RepID=A0A081C0K8_VECG1|nr:catalytic domain of components of various dehydrogenase complexes [Candidatus Vecturithrix granuli]
MATEILMPRQGNTVESCLILEWRKQEGESVQVGDVLCEVETDKATFEVESEAEGTLLKVLFAEGTDVPVLTPIAIVGQPGEDTNGFLPAKDTSQPAQQQKEIRETPEMAQKPSQMFTQTPSLGSSSESRGISPRARNLAAAKSVNTSGVAGTGPEGRIIERDILAAITNQAPLTPAAITALIEQGKQAPATGTGIGGRVIAADLRQPVPAQEMPGKAAISSGSQSRALTLQFGAVKEIPVKGVRKIIAARMLESLQTTAQLTMNASADASQLLAYRQRLKAAPESFGLQGVTINDLVLYVVAHTLPRFPFMNAHFLGDTIKEFERVHLGIAVDTPRGLMVPPVKNADLLSLKQLSVEAKRLTAACQEGKILPDELTGATFTVTNLGALGIESFTPVLNPPEVGILGVCAIQPKPVMNGDDVRFVPHIGLSLTFDHRAVDGAPAARFLKELSTALANFDLLLAG